MSADTAGPGGAGGYFEPLGQATYMRLTTFLRSGQPVPTPVHVETDGTAADFRTWDVSGKAKRLRHTASAARLIAGRHPLLHGRPIPWFHRMRGWVSQQSRLDPPPAAR